MAKDKRSERGGLVKVAVLEPVRRTPGPPKRISVAWDAKSESYKAVGADGAVASGSADEVAAALSKMEPEGAGRWRAATYGPKDPIVEEFVRAGEAAGLFSGPESIRGDGSSAAVLRPSSPRDFVEANFGALDAAARESLIRDVAMMVNAGVLAAAEAAASAPLAVRMSPDRLRRTMEAEMVECPPDPYAQKPTPVKGEDSGFGRSWGDFPCQ